MTQNKKEETFYQEERIIKIHSAQDYCGMRKAGRLAAETLDMLVPRVKPGITTEDINTLVHNYTLDHGGIPAPLGYRGFPKSVCTSVNNVVCHGIPGHKTLKDGDILNIDVTTILDGWHGDTSRMFVVGDASIKANRLIKTTFESLWRGIKVVRPGATTGDIGHAIQTYVEKKQLSVVRDFCGHGLGRVFHDAPNILHFGTPGGGTVLKEGMFFTIEPMVNAGGNGVKIKSDGWTAVTKDRSLSAQFEHSLAVTKNGYEVFTQSPAGLDCPPFGV
ncbi:MAG: type I methionyl aminopeptidase [Magnetovibrio sp.]|nr:type I methionyl aminopeptidase [Magnetovibrio sp.]|tara:strand:- start:892 stop:1716 length:825 start_codon:yes stop_codon:yes gene_type:complete